jgi:hypothetical protein
LVIYEVKSLTQLLVKLLWDGPLPEETPLLPREEMLFIKNLSDDVGQLQVLGDKMGISKQKEREIRNSISKKLGSKTNKREMVLGILKSLSTKSPQEVLENFNFFYQKNKHNLKGLGKPGYRKRKGGA